MRHVELLAPHAEPIVVIMGPRHRCSVADYEVLDWFVHDLKTLDRPVTFRVSGMITGPESFIEPIAEAQGHLVQVYGPDGYTPEGRARRLNKHDDRERDATMLVGAHALWVFLLPSDLKSRVADPEMVLVAQDLGVPVLYFLPESENYEIVEL